jgi:acetylornithine deacetylase
MGQVQYSPREMIDKLISFDTTSRESNLSLIDFVADYLSGLGVQSIIIPDETGKKANLFATIGPDVDGGVVLSGHTDVVPVDGQDWDSDPFGVIEADGKLFGRGTCDMKSFIAIATALAPEMLAAKLKTPIHFAFSYDEEIGCLGVGGIIKHIDGLTTKPRAVIVGEPTSMKVVNAHKGGCSLSTLVHGLEAHSSATQKGVSSIIYAAKLINFLDEIAQELRDGPKLERFEPPYTTIQVGLINGGTATNIIPKETLFRWEFRAVSNAQGDEIIARFNAFAEEKVLPQMRAVYPEARIETRINNRVPPLMPDDGSDAETLALALVNSNQTYAVSYGTEGGLFQLDAGIPAVICGPGSIDQAHKPNEWIKLSEVQACEDFVRKLIGHLAA